MLKDFEPTPPLLTCPYFQEVDVQALRVRNATDMTGQCRIDSHWINRNTEKRLCRPHDPKQGPSPTDSQEPIRYNRCEHYCRVVHERTMKAIEAGIIEGLKLEASKLLKQRRES